MPEELQIRIFGDASLPVLIYLPGLHGDWTLVTGFRAALTNRVCFVEVTYPRSLTWTIAEYANSLGDALLDRGIRHGWLLAESFGSQIAWALMEKYPPRADTEDASAGEKFFRIEGIVLAGGFVKHPWKHGPALLSRIGELTPMKSYRIELKLYAWYAKFRHRHAPEIRDSINEFVARRTDLDRQAMRQRLGLLKHYDPRPIARRTQAPVYYLAGLADPLVPWVLVRWWLRGNCPGYRGGKTFWLADHNVLATSPVRAADQVLRWMHKQPRKTP